MTNSRSPITEKLGGASRVSFKPFRARFFLPLLGSHGFQKVRSHLRHESPSTFFLQNWFELGDTAADTPNRTRVASVGLSLSVPFVNG